MRLPRQAALVAAALVLAGCARDGSDVGNRQLGDALSGSAPACSVVWVEGRRLARDYRGCEENGALQGAASVYECLDGTTIALYAERFYARLGGRVRAVEGAILEDPAYDEFWHDCVG